MKQNKVFGTIFLLFVSACAPLRANVIVATPTMPKQVVVLSATSKPTATLLPSATPELSPTATSTPDISALKTQGVTDPWILVTLGTKIPPPWWRQRVLFSPGGKFLVSSYSNKISLWETATFNKLSEFTYLDEKHGVDRFAFSFDDKYLAATASHYSDPKSHLSVWDLTSRKLKLSMELDWAVLAKDSDNPYRYPAAAIGFIPNSSRLVTANGNLIQIIDVEGNSKPVTIRLGQDIYASDISFPADGRFIYVFMEWDKDNGITSYHRLQRKHVVQIWDTNTHILLRKWESLENDWELSKALHGSYLLTKDSTKGTFDMMNLENEEVQQLPYRQGWSYVTADNKYILFSRYFGVDPLEERGMELWTTDSWRMLYKFDPAFYDYPDKRYPLGSDPSEIAISNDNRFLAIAYAGQIFVYDIRILTTP